jgi:DNA-binding MarR family transcriptional regulator
VSDPHPSPAAVAESFFAAADLLRKHANTHLREQGLTLARGKTLSILRHRGPLRVSTLAGKLGIASRSVTDAVDALERDGLAQRRPDPDDRRAVLVHLTDKGRKLLEESDAPRREAMQRSFAALTPAERAELSRLLSKLRAAALDTPP